MEHMGFEDQAVSITIDDQVSITINDEEISTADSEIYSSRSTSSRFGFFTRNGMTRLDDGNSEHKIIKRSFLNGLGLFGKEAKVLAVHKNSYSNFSGRARLDIFRIYSEAVAKKSGGGDPNIKYAWYGASRDEIGEIITHGFSRFDRNIEDSESHGLGVSLSPSNFSIDGVLSSAMDESGMRHLLLCRVILGKMEVVCAGSKQFQPSSEEFDSGVDNPSSPRTYVVWRPYMNSHIFPNYIVSFRVPCIDGFERIGTSVLKPNSPYVKFPILLPMLSNFLPRSEMILIAKLYSDYREKKVSRIHLIERLRRVTGDELLLAIIKLYRNKQLQARVTRSSNSARRRYAAGA